MRHLDQREIRDFLETVGRCEGEVWLEDREGNRLNLHSALSRYVAVDTLMAEQGDAVELFCQKPQDEARLYPFFAG